MGKIYSVDDVEKSRKNREREEFKEKIGTDIEDVFKRIFPTRIPPKKEKKFSFWKFFGILLLILILLTIIFGCIFLLKIFIKGLFFG